MSYRFMPDSVRSELKAYLDADNGSLSQMTEPTQDWLMARNELRPYSPTTLYRGLCFKPQNGKDFLKGHTVGDTIDHTWGKLSSWSSIRGVATRFALNSKELAFRDMKDEYLGRPDDEMGVVLELSAPPKSILCSIARVVKYYHLKDTHIKDWEYILRPMIRAQVKIRAIYTKTNIKEKTSLEGFS